VKQGQNHQLTLTRYFQERLLYRLSQSEYREDFLLKGGILLYAWKGLSARPTLDVDLLGRHLQNDIATIKLAFQQILSTPVAEDGIEFKLAELDIEEIIKEGNYTGLRVKVPVSLGNIRQKLQIDIGFGDAVTPGPLTMSFPTLLDMEAPNVLTYSKENLIAEKFEAMIALAEVNSRMKDFLDIYLILEEDNAIDNTRLAEAISATFTQRQTPLHATHPLFSAAFAEAPHRVAQWTAFIKKTQLGLELRFPHVMNLIKEKLEPIYRSLSV
jgi:predicted nucleotidyltransferase component of viral defense system